MIYLEMHNTKDGMKVFKKGTRYDFYLLQKTERTGNTQLNDEQYNKSEIDLSVFEWLPNSNISDIMKILTDTTASASEKCPIMYDRSLFGADKKWMSKNKTEKFKYPCIHSTPQKGVRYMWSNHNKGHFGISKVIFGESGVHNAIIDLNGEYGITHGAMGIRINNLEEGQHIVQALKSEKFSKIIKSMMFGNFRIDWNNFKTFKRDWWKEYVHNEKSELIDVSTNIPSVEVNTNTESNENEQMTETKLNKMKVKELKTYIKENKWKIKIGQKKSDLIKEIIKKLNK